MWQAWVRSQSSEGVGGSPPQREAILERPRPQDKGFNANRFIVRREKAAAFRANDQVHGGKQREYRPTRVERYGISAAGSAADGSQCSGRRFVMKARAIQPTTYATPQPQTAWEWGRQPDRRPGASGLTSGGRPSSAPPQGQYVTAWGTVGHLYEKSAAAATPRMGSAALPTSYEIFKACPPVCRHSAAEYRAAVGGCIPGYAGYIPGSRHHVGEALNQIHVRAGGVPVAQSSTRRKAQRDHGEPAGARDRRLVQDV